MTVTSDKIEVPIYHNILIWPLLLHGEPEARDEESNHSILGRWVGEFAENGWTEVKDPADPSGRRVSPEFEYEETVYFHPFVRDFLFGDGVSTSKDRALRVLSRNDVKRARVLLNDGTTKLEVYVHRVQLYICKPNVALFVMEVSNRPEEPGDPPVDTGSALTTLEQALNFQDQFRRIYPPFWSDFKTNRDRATEAGLCPRSVEWLGPGLKPLTLDPKFATNSPRSEFAAFTRDGAEPPVFNHWQYFFRPNVRPAQTRKDLDAKPGALRDDNTPRLSYRQIMDERIPAMSYFAVPDPSVISTGDFDRITFLDAAGKDEFPYQKEFLADRRDKYTYERFRHYKTVYFCSGYGFAMVGEDDSSKYNFFSGTLLHHFRHHYFRMGLVAHSQRAALLYFADSLSKSLKKIKGLNPPEELRHKPLLKRVREIQWDFQKFRSRSYFPEVTNQLQGQELFRFWYDHLGTKNLFDLVDTTSQRLHHALAEHHHALAEKRNLKIAEETRKLTDDTRNLTGEMHKLTKLAAIGVPLSVGLAAFSVLASVLQMYKLGFVSWIGLVSAFLIIAGVVWALKKSLEIDLLMWARNALGKEILPDPPPE
jgi:hypothetical protein